MNLQEILEFTLIQFGAIQIKLINLLSVVLILACAQALVWLIGRILKQYFKKKHVDPGRRFALQQFLKYIIYTITVLLVLEAMGVKFSVLWGGAAALLVGIGLGLQQTFNDLISGMILLIEGSVEIDDVVEVNGIIGTVTHIGLRTSKVETRNHISILIPNSKLVGDNTINWSHTKTPSRFQVHVGVSYVSNIELVSKLLLRAADEHVKILKTPKASVQLVDFGNSSLDFTLHFFTFDYLGIDFIRSELRIKILNLFREFGVEIPFPQRDLWLKNGEEFRSINAKEDT